MTILCAALIFVNWCKHEISSPFFTENTEVLWPAPTGDSVMFIVRKRVCHLFPNGFSGFRVLLFQRVLRGFPGQRKPVLCF